MKRLNLFTLLTSATLILSSCSDNNETLLQEEQAINLLKSYTIQRDANGAYSLDYNLNGNVKAENVIDSNTNTNNIYLYSSNIQLESKVTQDLTIDGNQLKIGFVDTNSKIHPVITILDEKFSYAKGANNEEEEMLSDYSITSNEDGTYKLDFTVKDEVNVDFVYNEDLKIYEVHLEKGEGNETTFSRILEKESGVLLKLDFVNHIVATDVLAKSKSQSMFVRRKPRTTVGNGQEEDYGY